MHQQHIETLFWLDYYCVDQKLNGIALFGLYFFATEQITISRENLKLSVAACAYIYPIAKLDFFFGLLKNGSGSSKLNNSLVHTTFNRS